MMACPKKYADELAAKLEAEKQSRKSRGKREPRPYYCNMCHYWHLKEGK